jgi:hypothetical protein
LLNHLIEPVSGGIFKTLLFVCYITAS